MRRSGGRPVRRSRPVEVASVGTPLIPPAARGRRCWRSPRRVTRRSSAASRPTSSSGSPTRCRPDPGPDTSCMRNARSRPPARCPSRRVRPSPTSSSPPTWDAIRRPPISPPPTCPSAIFRCPATRPGWWFPSAIRGSRWRPHPRGSSGGHSVRTSPGSSSSPEWLITAAIAVVSVRLRRRHALAEDDARTIAQLYDRLDTLFDEQRAIADSLQRALLPRRNPVIPDLDVASRFVAGADRVSVGGDWYSVIGTGGTGFAFVVGDVSGRGISAATTMAHLRFTIRAYLLEGHSPDEALALAARQITVAEEGHMATVLVGVGDAATGAMTLANAGHLPPVLCSSVGARLVEGTVDPPARTRRMRLLGAVDHRGARRDAAALHRRARGATRRAARRRTRPAGGRRLRPGGRPRGLRGHVDRATHRGPDRRTTSPCSPSGGRSVAGTCRSSTHDRDASPVPDGPARPAAPCAPRRRSSNRAFQPRLSWCNPRCRTPPPPGGADRRRGAVAVDTRPRRDPATTDAWSSPDSSSPRSDSWPARVSMPGCRPPPPVPRASPRGPSTSRCPRTSASASATSPARWPRATPTTSSST